MIIAIDGPAAAGKGTLARRLAEKLNLAYLDSGALYRAVGFAVLNDGGDPADPDVAIPAAETLDPAVIGDPALRTDRVADAASKVAVIPGVRTALLDFQRTFAHRPPTGKAGAVLDGRDIGTVVCPDADIKLFVTAAVEERANRRVKELIERGEEAIYGAVLQEMQERDARDRDRDVAPLKPAEDAIVIDTTDLDADAALDAALKIIADHR